MVKLAIKSMDLCGSMVGLIYKGKRSYHSFVGGILTIILMAGILSIFIAYLDYFFSKNKAKMLFEDRKYYAPPMLDVSENFSFAVMTQYGDANEIREDVVKVEAVFKVKNGSQWTFQQIEPIPCKPGSPSLIPFFNRLELSKGACFNTSGLALQGSHATEVLKYIQINFKLCMNDSKCYPEEDMLKLFDESRPVAIVYFVDAAFEIYNTSRRVNEFYNYVDQNLTFQNSKETNIYFSFNMMYIDDNYLFPGNPTNYSKFMINSFRDKGAVRSGEQTTVLSINLMASNYQSIIFISFMQMTELLASICSIVNIVMIIICSIGNYINHNLFQSDLINSCYESDVPTDDPVIKEANKKIFSLAREKYKDAQRRTSIKTLPETKPNLNLNNFILAKELSSVNKSNNQPLNQTDQSIAIIDSFRQSISQQQKIVKYQFSHVNVMKMIALALIPCTIKKEHMEYKRKFAQVNQSLNFYQDLKNVYRKLMEIDLLKYLLMTEEQLTMYQLIPKPQFKRLNNLRSTLEFASLINNPNFHFLKSKKYIDRALNNPINRELFVTRINCIENENKVYDKIIGLITK